jgi:hypothetical protein
MRLVHYVQEIVGISRRYRDNGHPQFWGRIMGTEADVENAKWLMDKFQQAGLADIRDQPVPLPPQWMPQSWAVTASAGGKTIEVATAQPTYASPGTSTGGLDLEAVYVGTGSEADLALSPDVRGKAAFFYGTDPTARTAGGANGAFKRISDRGAAAVLGIIAIPGNMRVQLYPVNSTAPSFAVGLQDGLAVRDMIARNRSTPVRVRVRLDVRMVSDLKTSTVWGSLPGRTDETIYLAAHRDGWFDSASDNASGVASLLVLAEYFAKRPQAERRRAIVFLGSSGHHNTGGQSGEWFAQHPELFARTALIMNCEHTGARQTLHGSPSPGNAPALLHWFASDAHLAKIVTNALDTFGVATLLQSDASGGGETGRYNHYAPAAQVYSLGFVFHTDHETPDTVSGPGMASVTRAYAKIIDDVNAVDLKDMRASMPKS